MSARLHEDKRLEARVGYDLLFKRSISSPTYTVAYKLRWFYTSGIKIQGLPVDNVLLDNLLPLHAIVPVSP